MRCFGDRRDGLLYRHRLRPPGLRQHVVRVLSQGLARHHGRAQSVARAAHPRGASARLPHRGAGRRRVRRGDLLSGRRFPRPLDRDREPCPRGADAIRQGSRAHHRAGDDARGAVRRACAGRVRFPQGRRRRRREGRAARRRLAALPAEGRGGGGAGALHARPGLAGMGAVSARHGYRYVLFDSLNRYYVAEEASELAACFADCAGRRSRTPSSSATSSPRSTTRPIPTTAWPRCSPAPP